MANTLDIMQVAEQYSRWLHEAEIQHERDTQRAEKKKKSIEGLVRRGKTRRDHGSGSHARHLANKDTRSFYYKESAGKRGPFPWHTCNGKRNRHRWTGKDKQTIILNRPAQFGGK